MSNNPAAAPYPGPRSFEKDEEQLFFGRDREVRDVYSLLVAHRAVLLYAQSGTGKTSLLKAGLVPLLEREGFEVLPIARVQGVKPKDFEAAGASNIFVFNVLTDWSDVGPDATGLASATIGAFLGARRQYSEERDVPVPRVVIFDQFEELFTAYPQYWHQRKEFVRQTAEAAEADHLLRLLFVIREDYLASLDPYLDFLPEQLSARYRLEGLGTQAAQRAVEGPLGGTSRKYAKGAAAALVKKLLTTSAENPTGAHVAVSEEYVEPVQLQVVCRNLWEKLPESVTNITVDHLETFGSVDQALAEFYDKAISETVRQTGVPEQKLRQWFNRQLITPLGTRGTVFEERETTGDIPNSTVKFLEDKHHIVRADVRLGARWYELTHDRLIKPIQESNHKWMAGLQEAIHARERLEQNAREWVRLGHGQGGLLDEVELLEANRWLSDPGFKELGDSTELQALVQASRREIEKKTEEKEAAQRRELKQARALAAEQRKRAEEKEESASRLSRALWRARVFTAIALIGAFVALFFQRQAAEQTERAFSNEQEAKMQAERAFSNEQEAKMQAERASLNEQEAKMQAERASLNEQEAKIQAERASLNEQEAKMQAKLASSRALATAAINQAGSDPELGVLLALHAFEAAKPLRPDALRGAADALGRTIEAARVRSTLNMDAPINKAAFSPDQKRLIVALDNGKLHVLKWPEGTEEKIQLEGQDAKDLTFWDPQFAPNANLVAAAASDGTVRIWNAETGKIEREPLRPPGKGVPRVLRFSSDGSMIAVGGWFTAWVWRMAERDPILTLDGHKDVSGTRFMVTAVVFDSRATLLATAAYDKTIRLWDLTTGKQVGVLLGHGSEITDLQFSSNGQEVLSASQDFTARIWNVATGRQRVALYGHANSVFSASYSHDGKKIVTSSADSTVRIWDTASGREIARLSSHKGPVEWARFAAQDRLIVSASWDGTVKTWSASGHTGRVDKLRFSPDGRIVATSSDDQTIRLWDAVSGDELKALIRHRAAVTTVRFSDGGKTLVSGDSSGRIEVWDPSTGHEVTSFCCQSDRIEDIILSSDGSRLVSAAGSGGVALWNLTREVLEAQLLFEPKFNAQKVAFSPNMQWIAASTGDGMLWIWRVSDRKLMHKLRADHASIYRLVFSPDSKTLLSGGHNRLAKLWDVASGEMRHELAGHEAVVVDGVFTPDSRRIITSDIKGEIFVWDTGTGKSLDRRSSHAGMAALSLNNDGTRLASFSWDRTAKVWDTKSWRELATLTHREQVDGGAISPDGTRLATFTPYDGVRIVPLDLAELIRLAKSRVTRNLTADECRRYLEREDCPPLPE